MGTRRILLALATAAVLILPACGSNDGAGTVEVKSLPTAQVRVEPVSAGEGTPTFQTVGRVKNVQESTISSKVMGSVREVLVASGDKVEKGQILIRVDERDTAGQVAQARGALAQAQAGFDIAKTNLERYEMLLASGSVSQAEYDQVKFQYDTAKGAVEQARGAVKTASSYLKETKVEAPYDGVVVDTMIERGEMVAPGRPLLRLEGSGALEFETTVGERDVANIEVGQKVTVDLDAAKAEVHGTVSEVVPTSDAGTHSNLVRILLEGKEGIRSGMFGRVRFPLPEGSGDAFFVDEGRVVRHGQLEAVWVVDSGGTVRLRLVRTGRAAGDRLEVTSGIDESERIIVSDTSELIDGQPAEVIEG